MVSLLVVFAANNLLTAEDWIVVTKNRADEPLAKTFVAGNSFLDTLSRQAGCAINQPEAQIGSTGVSSIEIYFDEAIQPGYF